MNGQERSRSNTEAADGRATFERNRPDGLTTIEKEKPEKPSPRNKKTVGEFMTPDKTRTRGAINSGRRINVPAEPERNRPNRLRESTKKSKPDKLSPKYNEKTNGSTTKIGRKWTQANNKINNRAKNKTKNRATTKKFSTPTKN